jgi:hypothetical protein
VRPGCRRRMRSRHRPPRRRRFVSRNRKHRPKRRHRRRWNSFRMRLPHPVQPQNPWRRTHPCSRHPKTAQPRRNRWTRSLPASRRLKPNPPPHRPQGRRMAVELPSGRTRQGIQVPRQRPGVKVRVALSSVPQARQRPGVKVRAARSSARPAPDRQRPGVKARVARSSARRVRQVPVPVRTTIGLTRIGPMAIGRIRRAAHKADPVAPEAVPTRHAMARVVLVAPVPGQSPLSAAQRARRPRQPSPHGWTSAIWPSRRALRQGWSGASGIWFAPGRPRPQHGQAQPLGDQGPGPRGTAVHVRGGQAA